MSDGCCTDENGRIGFCTRLTRAYTRIADLQAIVEKLPKTKDGVPVVPFTTPDLWALLDGDLFYIYSLDWLRADVCKGSNQNDTGETFRFEINECYSTREAAEAAKEMT